MAQIYRCDKCKTVVEHRVTLNFNDSWYDLCQSCTKELQKWIKVNPHGF